MVVGFIKDGVLLFRNIDWIILFFVSFVKCVSFCLKVVVKWV